MWAIFLVLVCRTTLSFRGRSSGGLFIFDVFYIIIIIIIVIVIVAIIVIIIVMKLWCELACPGKFAALFLPSL